MSIWDFATKRKNLITEELEVQCQRFSKIIKCSESSTITSKNHLKNQAIKATESTTPSESMAKQKNESDKISALMGQYLLKGYTLLDEYCLECQTPLMRKKFDPTFCIFCDQLKGSTTHGFNDNSMDRAQPENSSNHQNESDISDSCLFSELDNKLKQLLRNLNQDLAEILNRRTNSIEHPSSLRNQHEDIVSVLNVIDKTIETRNLLNHDRKSHT